MSSRSTPFLAESYDLGAARDGRPLKLAALSEAGAHAAAAIVATYGPWAHYGYTPAQLAERLRPADDGLARLEVQVGADSAGCVLIRPAWMVGPYLQMLAVHPPWQNLGIGAIVLAWYEREAAAAGPVRNVWLCTSAFNRDAQRFYLRHGYEITAIIDDLLRPGDDELLMRKRLLR